MENQSFNNLSTVKKVQIPLKPAALRIYRSIFPGCKVEDLREDGVKVHILDREFGIDSLLVMQTGQWFSIQEKYRDLEYWIHHDFTQEFRNGDGTEGEWFKLGAQLYFYGWGDPKIPVFYEWFILSISTYKMIIESSGGIEAVGLVRQNFKHGKSWFTGIKFETIKPAIIFFGTRYVSIKRLSNKEFSEPIALI